MRARSLGLGGCASRDVVAELMIAAGEATALWAHDTGVPLPFRSQLPPRTRREGGGEARGGGGRRGKGGKRARNSRSSGNNVRTANESLLQAGLPPEVVAFAQRPTLQRGRIHTDAPRAHAGLGLRAYTQITSPIRRYADCLAHAQIKAALAGHPPPLGEAALQQACLAAAERQRDLQRLQRQTERYFCLEYLRQQGPERVYDALVLGAVRRAGGAGSGGSSGSESGGGGGGARVRPAVVLLDELGLECPLMPNALGTPAGARVRVRVVEVSPESDTLTLEDAT